ncbi:DNA-binding transcriptional regulator, LysR family [Franzmannia pantelleriensis]|uniref:DNA-binding transcriptional regulator, LysR family n=1 Tax=Franzmannia pantelleriensis TaxID=48727 RepID=A0A1G9P887_9GAMM|nr:LysR family transcriptional regulator [Halomonas pantelleriensis]SDL94996.1 DNA-binding transcriptional regulator, LysR family [Halomonas pantelleriensis]
MNQLLAMRAFVRVTETGSFKQAADYLGLPRSTLSKLVSDLESHLGIKLLNRTTRTVTATSDGLAYYQHAVRLVAEVDSLDSDIRSNGLTPSGHLRIDAPSSFATSLLIPAMADFQREYPDISVALGVSDRAVNLVGEGVDCVIRAGRLDELSMVGRQLNDLDYVTCAAPDYLERHGVPSHPKELDAGHTRLGYFIAATGKPIPLLFEKENERFEMAHSDYAANDGNGLMAMLLAGLGVGQHFRCCVQPYLDAGELVPVLGEWSRPAMPFHILYPPNRHQTARLKVFIEWLLATFND